MSDQTKDRPKLPEIAATNVMKAIIPQNMDELGRFANMVSKSGMAPKDMQSPEKIAAAVMKGMEVGLTPFQSLSDIAVINGRPTIWGDALPALVRRDGHQIHEEVTGEGEKMVAICTLKRADTGEEITRTFSVADAKRAKLWGKQGPWQQYPQRMLAMRARSWAIRDGAPDTMKGLRVAEEERDTRPMKDVTPTESAGAARLRALQAARQAEAERTEDAPSEAAETPGEAIDGEIVDEVAVDTKSEWFAEGVKSYADFGPSAVCPEAYEEGSTEAVNWLAGFQQEFEKEHGDG